MASEEQSRLAADDVFRSCEPIFCDNARLLFSQLQRMKKEQGKRDCLLSWKLLRPVFSLEWTVRQFIKKAIGRA
jgi:hypothetical protein